MMIKNSYLFILSFNGMRKPENYEIRGISCVMYILCNVLVSHNLPIYH
jgi:hypothetical protein